MQNQLGGCKRFSTANERLRSGGEARGETPGVAGAGRGMLSRGRVGPPRGRLGLVCLLKTRSPVMLLVGTRPEALKLAPVAHALAARNHPFRLVVSGQHPSLARQALAEAGLSPDHDLAVHRDGNGLPDLVGAILARLAPIMVRDRPAMLLVQGDTATCLAGALAAFYAGIPIGHVEAGLRTGDLHEPFPEEGHRAMVGRIAALHFAPTRHAAERLIAEGIRPDTIEVVGNTSIDALHHSLRRLEAADVQQEMRARFPFVWDQRQPIVLVTVHRRENQGQRLRAIAAGLARFADAGMARIVLPLHPNPAVAGQLQARLGRFASVSLLPPLDHLALLWLMQHARLVVTDSGGIQEEAPALGIRTLVLREATERVEGVEAGVATLVPLRPEAIACAIRSALAMPPIAPTCPYGDGKAAERIAGRVEAWLGAPAPAARVRAALLSRRALP